MLTRTAWLLTLEHKRFREKRESQQMSMRSNPEVLNDVDLIITTSVMQSETREKVRQDLVRDA